MKKGLSAISALALMMMVACKGPDVPSDQEIFSEQEEVCLIVGYKHMIAFSEGDLQYSINNTKHIYRAGVTLSQRDEQTQKDVQTVQQYYVLQADEALSASLETVTGKLTLCSPTIAAGIRTYDIKNGTVIRHDDTRLWIWDPDIHLGVVVRLAE